MLNFRKITNKVGDFVYEWHGLILVLLLLASF